MAEGDEAILRREIAARRRAQAFQMRREGLTPDAIAARLGVSPRSVQSMVSRELRTTVSEADLAERRQLHAEALMDIWRALYARAADGELEAIDRFLLVEERLATILGLFEEGPGGDEEELGETPDGRSAPEHAGVEHADR